jgi:asparagine synthase (glutamine-hydrolysing)
MCGIAGGVGLSQGARPDLWRVEAMSKSMAHRGPDGGGLWTSRSGRAIFGHRRLAVIDLETGDQPMVDDSGDVAIVFNGEIYNYLELRDELTRSGQVFRTRSDTEALLRLVELKNERAVDELRGMFAFAVWDDQRGSLLMARDRIGKKPLFYTVHRDCIYFSSSLAALRAADLVRSSISSRSLDLYLSLGYIPAPHTIYPGIFKLPAASVATMDANGLGVRSYWDPAAGEPYLGSYEQALDDLHDKIEEAVGLRLRSDVPLGIFLSGGIDSSLVAAMVSRRSKSARTFCVGFPNRAFDESEFSQAVASHLGTEHRNLRAEAQVVDTASKLTAHFGEPYADSSALAVEAIAQHARRWITVSLGGDGGDEGFGGYAWYANSARIDSLAKLMPERMVRLGASILRRSHKLRSNPRIARIARGLGVLERSPAARFAALRSFINDAEAEILYAGELLERRRAGENPAEELIAPHYQRARGSALRKMRYADLRTYLADDLMPKVDVATMAHGLEARAPLLDQEVLAFGLSLPDQFLFDDRGGKRILRDLLARFVPRSMFERPKQGFSMPLQHWFAGELLQRVQRVADSEALSATGLLKSDGIRRLISENAAGVRDHSQRLFAILQLDSWLSQQ